MASPHDGSEHSEEEEPHATADAGPAAEPAATGASAAPATPPPRWNSGGSTGTPCSSASSPAAASQYLQTLLERPESAIDQRLLGLKEERDRIKRDRKRVQSEIRNSERKRSRLKARARLLNTNDLLEVYAMRVREANKQEEPHTDSNADTTTP